MLHLTFWPDMCRADFNITVAGPSASIRYVWCIKEQQRAQCLGYSRAALTRTQEVASRHITLRAHLLPFPVDSMLVSISHLHCWVPLPLSSKTPRQVELPNSWFLNPSALGITHNHHSKKEACQIPRQRNMVFWDLSVRVSINVINEVL